MKLQSTLALLIPVFFVNILNAQLCPGGGTDFASSVTFSDAWITGCLTGSSCNGGIEFDNRAACEPTTAIDACAPAPSCTNNAQDGSDIWFNFYALANTAIINVIQNVSFIACIQAFSGGPTCGSLTEIGCVKAGGPSSGVVLNLSGLTVGTQYYFRVFGSANPVSQRTGTFCFCGSAGLGSLVLPVSLSSFKATTNNNNVVLNWTTVSETNNRYFEIEHSSDGIQFNYLDRVAGRGTTTIPFSYTYTHRFVSAGIHYYRLKQIDIDGRFTYSIFVSATIKKSGLLDFYPVPASDKLIIQSGEAMQVMLVNSSGQVLKYIWLKAGRNDLQVSSMPPGMYILRNKEHDASWKFSIAR
jgi:hypothetical protein